MLLHALLCVASTITHTHSSRNAIHCLAKANDVPLPASNWFVESKPNYGFSDSHLFSLMIRFHCA